MPTLIRCSAAEIANLSRAFLPDKKADVARVSKPHPLHHQNASNIALRREVTNHDKEQCAALGHNFEELKLYVLFAALLKRGSTNNDQTYTERLVALLSNF